MNRVDMSLDDLIKTSKDIKSQISRGRRRGRSSSTRGGAGRDKIRRLSGGSNFKRSPARRGGGGRPFRSRSAGSSYRSPFSNYSKGNVESAWTHDLYDGGYGSRGGSNKLLISNLDFGVNNNDLKELFSEFGLLKSVKLHYDRSGRSLGTADLVFDRQSDAITAMKQYNGVPLDGRPMQIQVAADASVIGGNRFGGRGGSRNGIPSFNKTRGGPRGGGFRGRGGPRGGSSRGGRGGRGGPKPTQEQLDAELDAYIEKMDTTS